MSSRGGPGFRDKRSPERGQRATIDEVRAHAIGRRSRFRGERERAASSTRRASERKVRHMSWALPQVLGGEELSSARGDDHPQYLAQVAGWHAVLSHNGVDWQDGLLIGPADQLDDEAMIACAASRVIVGGADSRRTQQARAVARVILRQYRRGHGKDQGARDGRHLRPFA